MNPVRQCHPLAKSGTSTPLCSANCSIQCLVQCIYCPKGTILYIIILFLLMLFHLLFCTDGKVSSEHQPVRGQWSKGVLCCLWSLFAQRDNAPLLQTLQEKHLSQTALAEWALTRIKVRWAAVMWVLLPSLCVHTCQSSVLKIVLKILLGSSCCHYIYLSLY